MLKIHCFDFFFRNNFILTVNAGILLHVLYSFLSTLPTHIYTKLFESKLENQS